jgi:hypothetical protein
MTKIYISVPMRGRTDENIQKSFEKMEKLAAILLEDDVAVVNPFTPKAKKPDNVPIRYEVQMLGESISLMSLADHAFFVDSIYHYPGCSVERSVCNGYDIPWDTFEAKYICPDIIKEIQDAENYCVPDNLSSI